MRIREQVMFIISSKSSRGVHLAALIAGMFVTTSGVAAAIAGFAMSEPPDRPITLNFLGWNDAAVKCKFLRDNFDKLASKKDANDSRRRQFVLMAISEEILKRAVIGPVTDDEKAWSEYLSNEENDRLGGIDAKLDADAKRVVDELVAAVNAGKRPECVAEPPFVLNSEEAADVLEKLKAKVPDLAKSYSNERDTSARMKILEDLTKQAPAQLLERLKQRGEPPADLTEQRIKTDFALDLAVLRNKLRGHIAGDPSVRPPTVPERPGPEPKSRITPFEASVKQFVRAALRLPANRASLRTEADLKAFVAKAVESSARQFVAGDWTALETAETTRWTDSLTAEHLPILKDAPVEPPVVVRPPVVQPPVIIHPIPPISPIPLQPIPPIGMGRGCIWPVRNGRMVIKPQANAIVVPIGAFVPIR